LLLALTLCAAPACANLLDGHYQVTALTYTINDTGPPRGFNNTGLYISATERRVRISGAWRGVPIARNMTVERTIGDTLMLRDSESPASAYKFQIRNNIVSGRHALIDESGNRQIIDLRATIRRMSREEVDRLRFLF
jgi:hypothetical protein